MSEYESLIKLRSQLIQKNDIINKKGLLKNRYKFLSYKTVNIYTATTKSYKYTKFTLCITRIIILSLILFLINPFVSRYIDKLDKTNYYLINLTNEKLFISIGLFMILSIFTFIPIFQKADKHSEYKPTKVYFKTCVFYMEYVIYSVITIFILVLIALAAKLFGVYLQDMLLLLIVWVVLYYLLQLVFYFPALAIIDILFKINKSNYISDFNYENFKDQEERMEILYSLDTLDEQYKIVLRDIDNNDIVANSFKELRIVQKLVTYFEQKRVTTLNESINLYCIENKQDFRYQDYQKNNQ